MLVSSATRYVKGKLYVIIMKYLIKFRKAKMLILNKSN